MQCNLLGGKYQGTLGENKLRTHFIYDSKHELVFCDLPKVGSTFIKQILHIVTGHRDVRNPFLITGDEAHGIPFETFNNLNFDKIFDILVNYVKFMFVRDPFSRILSAYVDKLFIPNFVFWENVGRLIVLQHRKNPDKQSKTCGHNVHFPEFIKHIVTSETEQKFRNPHWYPMYEGCRPCHIEYDFIGKMESFKEDIRQLLKNTNLSHFVDVSSMDSQNDGEALSLSINRAFEVAQSKKSCLTLPQSLERAWKVLQIRGVISYKSEFPYKEIKENSNITKREFTEILLKELNKFPMDKESKKAIRQEVMYKAYQSVPKQELDHFIRIFLPDFTLFDYDKSLPKSSFDKNIKWYPFDLKL